MRKIDTMMAVAAMLVAGSAVAAEVPPPPVPPAAEKQICRKSVETGSLVKKRKVCLTRKQWSYLDDEHQRYANGLVNDNRGRVTGN